MIADIAEPGGAEQGVCYRVQDDVGVAVPAQTTAVGHLDPAEHDRTLACEGMDVEAHAGAGPQPARKPLFGPLEIRREGEFL